MKILLFTLFAIVSLFCAPVGRVAAVSGEAIIFRADTQMRSHVGAAIEQSDRIQTAKDSKIQIVFNDKGVVTIGGDSVFEIEEYPQNGDTQAVKLNVKRGFFKAITGAVAKAAPQKFSLKTKTATIGIRGTHIVGQVADEFEKIACTKGKIGVNANGGYVELLEGQITEFKKGEIPKSPRDIVEDDIKEFRQGLGGNGDLISKIKAIRLDKDKHQPPKEQLDEILSKIRQIKDNEARIAALDMLESELNSQLDQLYGSEYFKVDATKLLDAAPDSVLRFGYYTKQKVLIDGQKYSVDGKPYDSMTEAVNAAVPAEMYREPSAAVTNTATVSDKMGAVAGKVYQSWDGRGADRAVTSYGGTTIGFVKEGKSSLAFLQNDRNKAAFTVDFGGRTIFGSIAYDIQSGTKTQSYKQIVADSGKELVTPTSFFADTFFTGSGSSKFLISQMFYGRFFGSDAAQLSAYFETIANDVDINDPTFDKDMLGLFVLNKTDEYRLTKVQKGENATFSWGYWAKNSFSDSDAASITSAKPAGGWILPKETVIESTKEQLDALKTAQVKASYAADLIGTVNGVGRATQLISNGKVGLDMDFGKGSLAGQMSFSAANDKWALSLTDGAISDGSFKVTKFKTDKSSTIQIKEQQIGGIFFGSKADAVGGGFSLIDSAGRVAAGAFSGAKQ